MKTSHDINLAIIKEKIFEVLLNNKSDYDNSYYDISKTLIDDIEYNTLKCKADLNKFTYLKSKFIIINNELHYILNILDDNLFIDRYFLYVANTKCIYRIYSGTFSRYKFIAIDK
jgi:hypothetical protein